MHQQVNAVIGDFTSLELLEVNFSELNQSGSTVNRVKLLQSKLFEDLDHRLFTGVAVQRELAKLYQQPMQSTMSVVFTSGLGMNFDTSVSADSFSNQQEQLFGEPFFSMMQTPQVWLDYRAYERGGDLVIEWDYVEGLFPDGLIELMHSSYCEAVERLGREEIAWEGEELVCLPSDQAEEREDYNKTDWAVGLGLLPSLLEAQVERQPDSVAVRSGRGEISY
ncbi:MAG: non-ribosomal peptide synthetase, partial [Gammaproteobacteria bacterium]|nr:non-ribosomal peptide synthetase [Gammaproteobacteria bacterium]